MIVQVRFFNILASYTGVKQTAVILPDGASLRSLAVVLSRNYSDAFRNVIMPDGVLNPHLHFFRNGARVNETELDSTLSEGDEIMLFPAVAGGSTTSHPLRGESGQSRRTECPEQSSSRSG